MGFRHRVYRANRVLRIIGLTEDLKPARADLLFVSIGERAYIAVLILTGMH
ncbi:MAG: hypothetical protein R6U58_02400 [Bacteroidales bacterium]